MKILIVMDPGIKVPPLGYGGIERVIEILAKEYARSGHEVHLLVTSGSHVESCTVHDFGKEGFPPRRKDAYKAIPTAWAFLWKHRNHFDLIHSFGRLIYLLPILNHPVKKIMSYQREITSRNIRYINFFGSKNLVFTACSIDLLSRVDASGNWEAVYNAVEFSKYSLEESLPEDAPLIFLGRLEKIKGCHIAIKVAIASGNKLVIAGNISALKEEQIYFKEEIEPYIDGINIQYVGQVNDIQKNQWLGKAKALLFPIEWNEPFGIVMIEAMACGTPVIAFNKGSVREVIDEGTTGFKVSSIPEMVSAIKRINSIDRSLCRKQAESRFDASIIAARYLKIVSAARKTILLITTHQPTANPRMLKEYNTLTALDYKVTVLYSYNAAWLFKIDNANFKNGSLKKQDFIMVAGHPGKSVIQYFVSRSLFRIITLLARTTPLLFFKQMAVARPAIYLFLKAKKTKADIYIAHYLGALPAAVAAAKKYGSYVIFDAEDFHRGEQSYYPSQIKNTIVVENKLLPQTDLITTASPLIMAQYKGLYPYKSVHAINNVFSKKYIQTKNQFNGKNLKLFWFSQNIGLYRGLEIFINALNYLPEADIELTILGKTRSSQYKNRLLAMADKPTKIIFKDPIPPEEIFSFASKYDIGLAGEIPNCMNKDVCLSNKIFTYLLAGNCILASDVQGQKEFIEQYSGIGFTYKHNDAKDLADKIEKLYSDRLLLQNCKERSLNIAANELNWENESKKWLHLINPLLGKKNASTPENERLKLLV